MKFLRFLLFIILIPVAYLCYLWQIFFDLLIGFCFIDFFTSYEEYESEMHFLTNKFFLFYCHLIFD